MKRVIAVLSAVLMLVGTIQPMYASEVNIQYDQQTETVQGESPQEEAVSEAAVQNGWVKDGSVFYYYEKGEKVTGWKKLDGYYRYFLEDGKMYTNGWRKQDGYYRYFNEWGCMLTSQWAKIDGYYRYLNEWGCMLTSQWAKIDGYYRYLNEWGCMLTSQFMKIDGYYRYLNEWGCMMTGWQKLHGYWRWFNEWGCMMTGWQTLDGYQRYFNEWGCMLVGAQTIDGIHYNFNEWGCIVSRANGKLIAIDAGHQRYQNTEKEPNGPGSSTMKNKVSSGTSGVATGVNEYQLNLTVSLKLQAELEKRGYQVYMIRTTNDVNISNAERAKNAAAAGADILVRIHANGDDNHSVSGALTMAPSSSNPYLSSSVISKSQKLSANVIQNFCSATGAQNRGVLNTDEMTGINWCTMPVTIVEMGFMSNPDEDRRMETESYQNQMVQGIANGIDAYYAG